MTSLSSMPKDLCRRLRPLLADSGVGFRPLSAVQSGEHSRLLLTNEISRQRLDAVRGFVMCGAHRGGSVAWGVAAVGTYLDHPALAPVKTHVGQRACHC